MLAIGSPFKYAFSLSQGIVSATGRTTGILGPGGCENFILEVPLEQQPTRRPNRQEIDRQATRQPGDTSPARPLAKLGFTRLQNFRREIAQQYPLQYVDGVLVLGVRQFSAAAVSGLRRGHSITQAGEQDITDVEQLQSVLQDRDLSQGVRLRMHVPGGPSRYVLLSLDG